MGMVVISAGTTVPDCLSSIIVSRAGQGDMAVCNAIGSNIFNILILVLVISKWKLFPAVGVVLISLHLLFIAWALLTNPLGDGKAVINLE